MTRLEDDIRDLHGDVTIEVTEFTELSPRFGGRRRLRIVKSEIQPKYQWYVKLFAAASIIPLTIVFILIVIVSLAAIGLFILILRVMIFGN